MSATHLPLLDRITWSPGVLGGKAVIRGRRLAVEHVLEMLALGDTEAEILAAHPWLEAADIQACLAYAARVIAQERIEPVEFAATA